MKKGRERFIMVSSNWLSDVPTIVTSGGRICMGNYIFGPNTILCMYHGIDYSYYSSNEITAISYSYIIMDGYYVRLYYIQ
ncbi:hypothetical protein EUGRSUZ_C03988 [Eucalyptus grandis]|uniref:Uncharacterized protein n=2 Tax=Eucalyptus grandis TaxID=71139 RepID=A0ACC3LL86_EUCGR|nr:hypothetical protein EUGRSUZ_C03988 [Eucalyptus grandis]